MSSDFKRVNNIAKTGTPTYEKFTRHNQQDRLFESDWDELVIRFDRSRHRFVVKTASGAKDSRRIPTTEGKNNLD